MSHATSRKELSLKALELFQICAREGSLQAAARETGLTIITVSTTCAALRTSRASPCWTTIGDP